MQSGIISFLYSNEGEVVLELDDSRQLVSFLFIVISFVVIIQSNLYYTDCVYIN